MKTKMLVTKILSVLTLLAVCFTMSLSFAGCSKKADAETPKTTVSTVSTSDEAVVEDLGIWADAVYKEDTVIGTGTTIFYFEVVVEDYSVTFTVNTDKDNLGDALVENGVVSGDDGPYGLYVKTVNGILADYDVNSAYWNFTKNGEMLNTGVSGEKIESGAHYEMVYTKG